MAYQRETYLRFVGAEVDEDSGHESGVFQMAYDLSHLGILPEYEDKRLRELLGWFEKYLPEPARLAKSKYPRAQKKAIAWFKASSRECLTNVREMVRILECHDVSIRMIKTSRPGYIVYEDQFQVVAEPFSEGTF